jgi:hypothetical protein
MRIFILTGLIIIITVYAVSQEAATVQNRQSRGSIPEALLRPARGESPRYPIDTVIGELGRGQASEAAYTFANSLCEGLISGEMNDPALVTISSTERQRYITTLNSIDPLSYRIGGGRQEADGAFSFLVRFIGRDLGISGELYIRLAARPNRPAGTWIFEELLLDEARSREIEQQESVHRYDFNPYERFF